MFSRDLTGLSVGIHLEALKPTSIIRSRIFESLLLWASRLDGGFSPDRG
jgi:hypothetical protein